MTVATTERKQSFTTNGVTVDFPFTFKATDANQIYCQYTPSGGSTIDYTNFTVVLQEAGGTVTTNDVLDSGTLLVYRIVPLTQNTDYVEGGRFPAESHEAALDKLTLIDQDQQEDISRALKGPIGKDNPYTLAETLTEDELLIMQTNEIKSSGTTIADLNNAIDNANNAAQNAEKVLINLPSGQWAAGITFNSANEFMNFNGVGYTPLPTTTFPYVTQGNDPTQAPDNAFVQPFSNVNSSNISTYTDLGFDSVADMIAGNPIAADAGDTCSTGGMSWKRTVVSSPSVIDDFEALTDVNVKDFGAVGDGVTDDTNALQNAIATANTKGLRVNLVGYEYLISSELDLPANGFVSGGKITGASVKWSFTKLINNSNALLEFDSITIDSVWHSSFNGKINVAGEVLIQSSNPEWGVFWNNFGDWEVAGEVILDVDQGQSINENRWGVALFKGGLRVRGVATTGIRQCYGNSWEVLDTTGANMTASDSTTGWHVLNESVLNETNTIKNWDAEVSGNRGVRGNWNVQGHAIDATTSTLATTERNWSIFGSTFSERMDGDFIPSQAHNAAIGGEWDVLNKDGTAPYSLSTFGTMASTTLQDTTKVPSGIQKQIARETSSPFSGYLLNFDFASEKTVVLAMWISGGANFKQVETDGGVFTNGLTWNDTDSGWRLFRVVLPRVTKWVKLYLNDGSGVSYKQIRINSYFASITKATVLPALRDKSVVRGNELDVPYNTLINIPIPLVSAGVGNTQTSGILTVRVEGDSQGPSFIGVSAVYKAAVTCSRYGGTTKTVVLHEIANIAQGINTGATPVITVTPQQAAVDFQVSGASFDPIRVFWEYEPIEHTAV